MKLKALLIAGALGCAALAAPAAANAYQLVVAGNMCLDDTNGSTSAVTQLQVWQCQSASSPSYQNQQWNPGPGGYTLKNSKSGRCLDVQGDNHELHHPGDPVVLQLSR